MSKPRILLGKPMQQWAQETGICPTTLRARIDAWGWTEAEAVGLVPHVDLRGKCRGKPVTKRYKKRVDKGIGVSDNAIKLENIKWF